jgi:hypothetical protein
MLGAAGIRRRWIDLNKDTPPGREPPHTPATRRDDPIDLTVIGASPACG